MSKISKSDRTKADILATAWSLISRKGDTVSMAEIAQAVGLTRQAIYTHFPTRAALLVALVRDADHRFAIWEAFTAATAHPDPTQRLEACLDAWFAFVVKIHPVATVLIRTRVADQDAEAAWTDRMDALKDFLTDTMTGLAEAGVLKPGWPPRRAAEFLWSVSSVQNWDLLVRECNWPPDQAATMLKSTIRETLLVAEGLPSSAGAVR